MNEENFIELVTKYLSKESTPDENIQLNELLKQEEYNRLFLSISEKWNVVKDPAELSHSYLADRFNSLTSKIKKHDPSFDTYREGKIRTFFSQPYLLRVAASIIFFLTIGVSALYYWGVIKSNNDSIVWKSKSTMMGEKSLVTLSDGTKIILNADSKLKFPSSFEKALREVYLEGEAYFEVTHNPAKPFVVHSGDLTTTVLGTKFNVCAYPNENDVSVALIEGKVQVSADKSNLKREVVLLTPSQQLIYNIEEAKGIVDIFDSQKVLGWKENKLIFDNERLSTVLIHLERAFGTKFVLADKSFGNLKIRANFEKESPLTIAEVIKKATGLWYKRIKENHELKEIVFFKK
ncbi:MAG: FecR domain-containing protein [Ignavibacteriales bacterium]|nr:FecR domain-containing protein [Ignavibacteriales bacterium]